MLKQVFHKSMILSLRWANYLHGSELRLHLLRCTIEQVLPDHKQRLDTLKMEAWASSPFCPLKQILRCPLLSLCLLSHKKGRILSDKHLSQNKSTKLFSSCLKYLIPILPISFLRVEIVRHQFHN